MDELKKYCLPDKGLPLAFTVLFFLIGLAFAIFGDFDSFQTILIFMAAEMATPLIIDIFTIIVPGIKFNKIIKAIYNANEIDELLNDFQNGVPCFGRRIIVGKKFLFVNELYSILCLSEISKIEWSLNHNPNIKSSNQYSYLYITTGNKEKQIGDSIYINDDMFKEWEKLCNAIIPLSLPLNLERSAELKTESKISLSKNRE